ncbi:HAE1 family hydrophobic/amphiphilic exporter-1 [Bacillus tianshenii]|uniref:HAE1 family hydrophobic/amphiphilic exporter-1 n=1 Tax=Sutcliffiella tianshenii TaxID=1463404 RepID=A0ABS2P1Y7_9BACI|nr:efflux RND transporter permease subunit [Bacillus tianshenii]MBM7620623.1 HAE1 family hydrophobic/amphiphilic exporter-1 [Bacillus tianshenii]
MKIAKLSVLRPIAMSMVIVLMLILGAVSMRSMTVDLFPELTFPIVAVTTTYEGAGPEEIENLISSPIENAMGTLPNVESVTSISRTGGSLVLVAFTWGTNMDFAALDMRERIDAVRDFLPPGAQLPRVLRFNPSDLPIVQLAITDPSGEMVKAKRLAEEEIEPELNSVDGIASISVEGGAESEVRVTLDPNTLSSFGISIDQLQQIIASENLNLPGGALTDQNQDLPIRITGEYASITDIKTLPIPNSKGIIQLDQLGEVKETLQPTTQLSYLNGEPAVGMSILKQSGSNTVTVANDINKKLEEIKETLPEGVEIKPIFDQSQFIEQSIRAVASNMILGSLLAALVLYFFLRNLRSTLIILFSIPLSIVTTFIFMYFSGQTLNLLTLGGLALGIGMMVDNATVILENIYRLRQKGYSLKDAAIEGTSEVGPAIIASTLTTVIVFLPIVFVDGLAAQLFKPLALVVSFSLLASLFTALIIVPLFSSLLLKVNNKSSRFEERFSTFSLWYRNLLYKALQHPKKTISLVLLLLVASLFGTPFIGKEFLPQQDQSFISMTARLPDGSSLDATYDVMEEIDERLKGIEEIDLSFVTVGGTDNFSVSAGTQLNRSNYSILLVPLSERNRADTEVGDEIRELISDIPGVEISISSGDSGFSQNPVSLSITGPDLDTLKDMADQTITLLSDIEGIREPSSNYTEGNPEIVVDIDRVKASQFGVGSAQIASAVSSATRGVVASRMAREGEELDIRLTIEDTYTSSIQDLETLLISTPTGENIPLQAVATVTRGQGPSQITRTDRLREITVNADIVNRDLGSVVEDIEKTLKENVYIPTKQYKITIGGQDEQMNDAFFKLGGALALAVVLVYMVMAAQFESYYYPFIIMFSVPLTIIGIIIGLLVTFQPLGVGSLVGMLILTGIVVNNAIVFVDYVNLLKKDGNSTVEAILIAGPTRIRPILMTTLTTILGLIPLTLGIGEGMEIQQPMAIVIVFGLSFATLITLVLIPVLYYLLDQFKEKRQAKKMEKVEL